MITLDMIYEALPDEWGLSRYEDGFCIEAYSNAGEHIVLDFTDPDKFIEHLERYVNDYEPEEHAENWIICKHERPDRVPPTIRELIRDAYEIEDMLDDLLRTVKANLEDDDNE